MRVSIGKSPINRVFSIAMFDYLAMRNAMRNAT
jgi:hypothetical protein